MPKYCIQSMPTAAADNVGAAAVEQEFHDSLDSAVASFERLNASHGQFMRVLTDEDEGTVLLINTAFRNFWGSAA